MDYYSGSSGRGRSFRGGSHRGSGRGGESSYRGSRGVRGGRGGYSGGRGGASSFYGSKYEGSSSAGKYGSEVSKHSFGGRFEDSYSRRSESSYASREHRDMGDIIRKRARIESYSGSQGSISRRMHEDDDYRGPSRYSDSRSYEESRVFKKPRVSSPRDDHRAKEPLRSRPIRGRVGSRGGISRRGRDSFGSRRRGSFSRSATATTSEILAFRRAKLQREREKSQNAEHGDKSAEKKNDDATASAGGSDDKPKEGAKAEGEEKTTSIAEEKARERTTAYGSAFMKLVCPHCHIKCITFKEYAAHLEEPVHVRAMKERVAELQGTLASMRIAQREKQKIADEEDLTSMTTRTYFCPICKLNYSQEKAVHQSSELHKKLKAFLMPYCRTCRQPFPSPMSYEVHLCSLLHLRRKHAEEKREKRSTSDILDKFMVLDSVGSGDEEDDKEGESDKKEGEEKVKDEDLNLGSEFIRTVQVMYCEVCRTYLPRNKEPDAALKNHCRTKVHLHCYLDYGNEALLEKMNENDDSKQKAKETNKAEKETEEEVLDSDKLWDDVGELLSETQVRDKSDDEDEEGKERARFDRFKSKEKLENGELTETDAADGAQTANNDVDDAKADA